MTYAVSPFQLHQPGTIAEAVELMRAHPDALYLAGGTDLVVNLRKRIREPGHVINLRTVTELKGIRLEGNTLYIGALTTLSELSQHPEVVARVPMLAEAAGIVAGPTIRNMATMGGNLVLDTRCRYYNQSYFWRKANNFCLKKAGSVCHVAPGGSFCWAAFSADTPPVLMLLDAQADLAGPGGTRSVALRDFYGKDGRWSLGTEPGGLAPGELILRVRVPLPERGWHGVYEKLRVRDSIDYPLVGLALRLRWADEGSRRLAGLGLALTAVNPRPEQVAGTESLVGKTLDLSAVEELKRLANRTGKPMRTTVADPAYRRAMVGSLVERAVGRLAPELGEKLRARAQWA
ncbi:MAG TPA: FAD binding domain-containing protein [bacterium]|nr:FAD binding domain-containing protein [bacterium]